MDQNVSVIGNNFNVSEVVYVKHDIDQLPRMITGIIIRMDSVCYELSSGTNISNHFGYELTKEKTIY